MNLVKKPYAFLLSLLLLSAAGQTSASSTKGQALSREVEIEWYPPETEQSKVPDHAILVISGKTRPGAQIKVEGENVTVLTSTSKSQSQVSPAKNIIKTKQTVANALGYFELSMDFPQGLIQIPILVTTPDQNQNTFLINFNVSLTNVKMNKEVTTKKTPAAAKSVRLWFGLGTTYQTYSQSVANTTDVTLQNTASPSILARAGYWGSRWGFDFFFRDAPGKIDSAVQPFRISSDHYHWQTIEGRGHYQFTRGNRSRLWGMPSQWLLLFGSQFHKMPFLDIDATNAVAVHQHQLVMATLGVGLLLAQERDWSYEFALEYQTPLSTSAESGSVFKVSSPIAFDVRLGVTNKLARNWRTGIFAYLQSHKYSFNYTNANSGSSIAGSQSLFYSTVDMHIGYEY